MNNIDKLSKELLILQRNQKIKKHIAIQSEDFLHSGELSVVDFIDNYSKGHGESPTLVQISKSLVLSQATVTVLINRLIDKELVVKIPSPKNRSKKLVSLSEKGDYLLCKRRSGDNDNLVALLEYLGEEDSENFTKIIVKINEFYMRSLNIEKD